jgi:steroid 5-alpha reductase family enzyme
MFIVFLIIETIADDQMFAFQTEKHSRSKKKIAKTGDYALGFLTHGLFKYSRHPNFMAEQAMWLTLACFSISVQNPISYYYNTGSIVVRHLPYAFYGALILVLLFQGSTDMTEK